MTTPTPPPPESDAEAELSCGSVAEPAGDPTPSQAVRRVFSNKPMMFPNAYTWLLLFSAMDIMLTWVILSRPDGREVNPLADAIIGSYGLTGAIVFKFAMVLVFIIVCEVVGRLRVSSGRLLSRIGVGIAAFPVVWSLFLLASAN